MHIGSTEELGFPDISRIPTTHTMSMLNIDSKDIVFNPGTDGPNVKVLVPVSIPDDAMADNKIFPGRVLYGYHTLYNPSLPWWDFMLTLARETPAATGVSWCAGMQSEKISIVNHSSDLTHLFMLALNSGSTGGKYWFGYLYTGGPIDSSDFVEAPKEAEVTKAQAFS
jgi:hypothetical protein